MQLLGGAEAVPEDILRILKQVVVVLVVVVVVVVVEMQLLGVAEAVLEDILRILKQEKLLENKSDDFFHIDQIRQSPLGG